MPKQAKYSNTQKWLLRGGVVLVAIIVLRFALLRGAEHVAIQAAATTMAKPPTDAQKNSIRQLVRAFRKYGDGDKRKLAYILATARHEAHFLPIPERRCSVGSTCWYAQEKYWHTGYYGRGLTQLTWQRNYQKMSDIFGVDFVSNPDLVLQTKYAAPILVYGMMNGTFSRKKLGDYINEHKVDYRGARWTVNGQDKANLLASYAVQIYEKL